MMKPGASIALWNFFVPPEYLAKAVNERESNLFLERWDVQSAGANPYIF
jgi:hypothetical protein